MEETGERLQRSSGFREKVDSVRRLPQETAKEKKIKQKEAKLLRMEAMLDSAKLAIQLTETLENNPKITPEEFKEKANKSGLVIHPEVTNGFIKAALEAKQKIKEVVYLLEKEKSHFKISPAVRVFQWVAFRAGRELKKPEGQVNLITSYPLALILSVGETSDFDKISPKTNVGGFYAQKVRSETLISPDEKIKEGEFPIIVVNDSRQIDKEVMATNTIESHEKIHAENMVLRESLVKQRKVVWTTVENYSELKIKAQLLRAKFLEKPEETEGSPEWYAVLNYAYGQAKDEILAYMHQKYMGAPVGLSADPLVNLKKREIEDGLYDYFFRLGIFPSEGLYYKLWENYEKTITDSYEKASVVVREYNRLGLYRRIDLMRWVLAQMPLKNWPEQLERTLFVKEAEGIKKTAEFALLCLSNGAYYERAQKIESELRGKCRSNQDRPFLGFIEEAEAEIKKIKSSLGFKFSNLNLFFSPL